MSKSRIKTAILSLVMGGCMMITGCSQEAKTVALSFTPDERNNTVAQTGVTFYDRDFVPEAGEYNERLCSLCAAMSASAFSGKLSQENFTELSFHHIAKFSYEKSYREDAVGVVMASRTFADQTLIFIVIRGTKGREWYSNFDVGFEKEHKSFSACADFLMRKAELYIANYALDRDRVRFLVTGYSRGGAAANLLSKRLIDTFSEERVAAYTFASPNTTTESSGDAYRSIFNLVKSDDVFTQIPLSKWGYRRYGTDIRLDRDLSSTDDEVREVFRSVTGESFSGFEDSERVADFLQTVYELAPSVYDYYYKRYEVGETSMTMYDYMMTAAKFLCGDETEDDADLLTQTVLSDFADMSFFFLNGVDPQKLLAGDVSFEKSRVGDSHSMLGYMALLDAEETDESLGVSSE